MIPDIAGVGIDSVEIARMRDILSRDTEHFLNTTFTQRERTYCDSHADPAPHYAGTFAAKEAVRKATGELLRPFKYVEVVRTETGKPEVWAEGVRSEALHLSITHTTDTASAIVIHTP